MGRTSSLTSRWNSSRSPEVGSLSRDHRLGPGGPDRGRRHRAEGHRRLAIVGPGDHHTHGGDDHGVANPDLSEALPFGEAVREMTAVINSSGRRTVSLTPVKNSDQGTVRCEETDASSMEASTAARNGWPSPAGLAVPRFPPMVPAFRIWGDPTVRAASASPLGPCVSIRRSSPPRF